MCCYVAYSHLYIRTRSTESLASKCLQVDYDEQQAAVVCSYQLNSVTVGVSANAVYMLLMFSFTVFMFILVSLGLISWLYGYNYPPYRHILNMSRITYHFIESVKSIM